MKSILAFTGSNSPQSINRMLLEHARDALLNTPVKTIDLRDFNVPIYSQDLEALDGIPENIQRLRKLFDAHDAYMIASPEHNGMMPAFFKNIIDWLSRMEGAVFQNKPVLLMSASPGPRGGQTNLANMKAILPYWGASAVFADIHIGNFHQVYDSENNTLSDREDEKLLENHVRTFEEHLQHEARAD